MGWNLQWCNVLCLWAFLTFTKFESNFLTFCQRNTAVASAVYLTEVYEYICAAIVLLDKSITFFIVEPFYRSV